MNGLKKVNRLALGEIIFNNKPLRGSCGGNPDGSCSVCGGDINKCEGQLSDNNPI